MDATKSLTPAEKRFRESLKAAIKNPDAVGALEAAIAAAGEDGPLSLPAAASEALRAAGATLPEKVGKAAEAKLSDEQAAILEVVKGGGNVFVTGPGGTGKSFLLEAIKKHFAGRLPVTASTGIAAVAVGGVTLHSWTGIGIGKGKAETLANQIVAAGSKGYANITGFNRLAIDEVSMLSAGLFEKLDKIFRIVRKVDKPFGGIQLILFGDFLQLPPVITDEWEINSGKQFCFESAAWYAAQIKTAVLTKIFRQQDAEFAQALNDIRVGEITDVVRRLMNSRHAKFRKEEPPSKIEPVIIHTHNRDVDTLNEVKLANIAGEQVTWTAKYSGRESAIKLLQKNCIAGPEITCKVGAQVMLLKNEDTSRGLANGSVGIVEGFAGDDKERPIVRFKNGEVLEVERHEWEIAENGKIIATCNQMPLRLAWAITAHKSQGMSLDAVRVFLGKVFEDGQAYVALSRARTLEGLYIENGGRNSIRANAKAVDFYRRAEKIY
jgi:ATP-dependent DNA helicase PIF1